MRFTAQVAGGAGPPRSPHPVDELIRELLQTGRSATPAEVREILQRMAAAPFNPASVRVRRQHRGLTYLGHPLGAREPSLFYHLVQRVLVEMQWAAGTTAREYLADLRRAIRAPRSRVVIYEDRGGHLVGVVALTEDAVPVRRRGPDWLPHLLVVYSADRGMIVSGYQFSNLSAIRVPGTGRWLES